jgi:very-short-patch-repair endonuclease
MLKNKIPYNPYLKKFSRELRNNMTFSEVQFWKKVRKHSFMGYDFHRQKPILNFIVDFYCRELKLVIELDGITHHDDTVAIKDQLKEDILKQQGLEVMRFSDHQVIKDMENVMRAVENYILSYEEKFGVNERVLSRRIHS